jgi:hypothetical protein
LSPDWTGLIGSLGVLAVVLVGFWYIVRGLILGARDPSGSQDKRRLTVSERAARVAGSVLSVAVIYRYFITGYAAGYYNMPVMLSAMAIIVVAMAMWSYIEVLVSVAALVIFLVQNVSALGVGVAAGLIAMFFLFNLARFLLGR